MVSNQPPTMPCMMLRSAKMVITWQGGWILVDPYVSIIFLRGIFSAMQKALATGILKPIIHFLFPHSLPAAMMNW